MNKKIVLIRANSIRSDTRTIKMYNVIQKISQGYALLWNRDSIRETTPPADRFYGNAPLGSKVIFLYLPFWFIWCFWRLVRLRPDAVHGCDLEGVIPGYWYAKLFRKRVIFDIHDATEGKYPLPKQSLLRKLFLWLDRYHLERADGFLIPDPERLDQLEYTKNEQTQLLKKGEVTYNSEVLPSTKQTVDFTKRKELRIAYVGALNKRIRGIEYIIEAAQALPTVRFEIAGMGADLSYFTEEFERLKLPNVTFHGRISHDQAMELNNKADLMVSLLDPEFRNYKYASSTKLFEAMKLGKPIIVTANTATGHIVEKARWGLAIPYQEHVLVETIKAIMAGRHIFELDGSRLAPYSWSTMEKRIADLYERVLSS